MAFVLLPCDLPTWPRVERHLQQLLDPGITAAQLTAAVHALYTLCNVSIEPEGPPPAPPDYFAPLQQWLEEDPSAAALLRAALPRMARCALDLPLTVPHWGVSYSLQQQSDCLVLSRSLVASLVAHTLLSTLPRRGVLSHPTLCNPSMAAVLHSMHSEDERAKLRALLQYYSLLEAAPQRLGEAVILDRKVMDESSFLRLRRWRLSRRRLCRLQAQSLPMARVPSSPCLLACCCTALPARAALHPHAIQDCRGLALHPELLATALLAEELQDNEALRMRGVLSPTPPQAPTPQDLTYCLLDADDYSDVPRAQYEPVNFLRELNKCYLSFGAPPVVPEQVAPPAGVVLRHPLHTGVSTPSTDSSMPPTPAGGPSVEDGEQMKDDSILEEMRKDEDAGDVLSRVLAAVQRLQESGRGEEEGGCPGQERGDEGTAGGRMQHKPPLPDGSRRQIPKAPRRPRVSPGEQRAPVLSPEARKASEYQSCCEEVPEEEFFSARQSLDEEDGAETEGLRCQLEKALTLLEAAPPGPQAAAAAKWATTLLQRAYSDPSMKRERGSSGRGHNTFATGGELSPLTNPNDEQFEVPQTAAPTLITESWGCEELCGDPQLKAMLQWAAASEAGVETILYCTYSLPALSQLPGVYRALRRCCVGQLVEGVLGYCRRALQEGRPEETGALFDKLLGLHTPATEQ